MVRVGVGGLRVVLGFFEHVRQRLLTLASLRRRLAHGVDAPAHGHLAQRPDDVVDGVSEGREHDDARVRVVLREVSPDNLLQTDHLRRVMRAVARHRLEHVLHVPHDRGRLVVVVQ